MTNTQILAILRGLSDVPRPLAELLPGASRAVLVKVVDYLGGVGLADVRVREGVLTATIAVVGQLFVEKARWRGEC